MARTVAIVLGIGFLLVGVAGFVAPTLLGMHLSMTHSVIHLVSGAAALFVGLKTTLPVAKSFDIFFGAIYGLLGVAGFVFGEPGTPVMGPESDHLLSLVRGELELGTSDHIVHILLGSIFLIGGLATRIPREYSGETPPAR